MTLSFTELELWLFALCALLAWRLSARRVALIHVSNELQRVASLVARIADGKSAVTRDKESGHIIES